MFTGEKLGAAMREAMRLKGVKQKAVAEAFGITQPSVSEWLKHGRIDKEHIPKLVAYFADNVGPEHWGLPAWWYGVQPPQAQRSDLVMEREGVYTVIEVKKPAVAEPALLPHELQELVSAVLVLPPRRAHELLAQVMLLAEEYMSYGERVIAQFGASGRVSDQRAAEKLPPAPPLTAPGKKKSYQAVKAKTK